MDAVVLAGDGKWKERFDMYVVGKRVIDYPIDALKKRGFPIHVVTSDDKDYGVDIIRQKKDGVIGAIASAYERVGAPMLVVYGDVVAEDSFYYSPLNTPSPCSVVVVPTIPKERHSTLAEKGLSLEKRSSYIFGGAMKLDEECLVHIDKYDDIIVFINDMLRSDLIRIVFYDGYWVDVDNKHDLIDASLKVIESKVRGVAISREAEVHPTSVIKGNVIIDKRAVIGPYSIIEGPAYIGEGVYVQGHVVISQSSIEMGSSIDPFVYIRESSVQPFQRVKSFSKIEKDVYL